METKSFDVTLSYTLDYVAFTCPRCNYANELQGNDVWDAECKECGLEIPLSLCNDTTSETEVYDYDPEDESVL